MTLSSTLVECLERIVYRYLTCSEISNIYRLSLYLKLILQLCDLILEINTALISSDQSLYVHSLWDSSLKLCQLSLISFQSLQDLCQFRLTHVDLSCHALILSLKSLTLFLVVHQILGFLSVKVGSKLSLFSLNILNLQLAFTGRTHKLIL